MFASQPSAKRIAGAAAVAAALFVLARTVLSRRAQARVAELWIFPVKSCSGMQVQSARLLASGFEYDRQWAIVRKGDLKVMTMRECPIMKKIVASVDNSSHLVLRFPGKDDVRIPLDWTSPRGEAVDEVPVAVWSISGSVQIFGEQSVHAWITDILNGGSSPGEYFLGKICGLRDPGNDAGGKHRSIVPMNQKINMHDFSTLHIISLSSVESLRSAIGDPSINALRFRANIVVRGSESYDEDTWDEFSISGVSMRTARLCGRCAIPTINDDAERHKDFLPTAHLRRNRLVRYTHRPPTDSPQAMFGIAVFQQGQLAREPAEAPVLRVGDTINVNTRRAAPVFVTEAS